MTIANAQPNSSMAGSREHQILVIMTNHASYPSRSDTTGLWLTELTHFTDVVEAAGYTTVFASPKGGAVPLDERSLGWLYMDKAARQHLQSATFRARLQNTLPIADVDPSRFSAIYFTGATGSCGTSPTTLICGAWPKPSTTRVASSQPCAMA
ncbi:hypothetical protein PBOI14_44420 [Pseudomonas sp. Boi14]|nr:hypothetical protein PBOI14_44420 [Pseudomonas sp. Boi14]